MNSDAPPFPHISVIIPARNEAAVIGNLVTSILEQAPPQSAVEVIVVDDDSTDATAREAERAGATVLPLGKDSDGGNPAIARNRGAAASHGDPIVFLDADCTPHDGWLATLLDVHARGIEVAGGSLGLPDGLSLSARCDYYCGWYHAHPRRPSTFVRHHPPTNISVRREAFFATDGFHEQQPIAYAHEELAWQAEVQRRGGRIFFEPGAVVDHHNRPGFKNLLRRNYRWGYSSIESKAETGTARFAFLYRYPLLLVLAAPPLAFLTTAYLVYCWLRAGFFEPLWMSPAIFLARAAWSAGMAVGGIRWMSRRGTAAVHRRPGWE